MGGIKANRCVLASQNDESLIVGLVVGDNGLYKEKYKREKANNYDYC